MIETICKKARVLINNALPKEYENDEEIAWRIDLLIEYCEKLFPILINGMGSRYTFHIVDYAERKLNPSAQDRLIENYNNSDIDYYLGKDYPNNTRYDEKTAAQLIIAGVKLGLKHCEKVDDWNHINNYLREDIKTLINPNNWKDGVYSDEFLKVRIHHA